MTSKIAVVGAGVMGTDIATAFLEAGWSVQLADLDPEGAARAASRIERRIPHVAASGKLAVVPLEQASAGCAAVIEAITESLQAKQSLLARLATAVDADTLIFSNTSTLSIEALAGVVSRPERFAGLHFFFPAHRNPFLEIIRSSRTNARTLEAAIRIAGVLKKQYVGCSDRPGFVVNAFYLPFVNEAVHLVDEGLGTPGQVEAVAQAAFGIRMGPLAINALMNPETSRFALGSLAASGACSALAPSIVSGQASQFKAEPPAEPLSTETEGAIRDRLLGAVLLPCLRMLAEGIPPHDIDLAAQRALQFSLPPVALMNSLGRSEVERIVACTLPRWEAAMPASIAAVGEFPIATE
ncbi:MAG: 3-hydroxyacyl-CoA dehydrogenase [Ramlibacter sp.]|nr:3-hydroxyacyl-CoA dehydrogenase [Ramlibacter sp.]